MLVHFTVCDHGFEAGIFRAAWSSVGDKFNHSTDLSTDGPPLQGQATLSRNSGALAAVRCGKALPQSRQPAEETTY
jgi:hypothetical protein